jgi:hemin uptake protein HemP
MGGENKIDREVHVASSCSRLIRSEELLGDDGDLLIDHNGEFYLLSTLPGGRLTLTGWDGGQLRFTGHRSPLR